MQWWKFICQMVQVNIWSLGTFWLADVPLPCWHGDSPLYYPEQMLNEWWWSFHALCSSPRDWYSLSLLPFPKPPRINSGTHFAGEHGRVVLDFWWWGCGWHRKQGIAKTMLARDLYVLKNTKNTLREVLVWWENGGLVLLRSMPRTCCHMKQFFSLSTSFYT